MGEADHKWTASLKAILFGFCAGAIVCTVCLLLFAFIFTQAKLLPLSMIRPLVLIACLFGSFIGGFCAARKTKDAGDVLRPDYGACFVRRAGLGQRGENGAAFYILYFGGLFFHASFGSYRRNLGSKQKKQAKIVFCASFFPALWYNKI